jgi:hypothetical protein
MSQCLKSCSAACVGLFCVTSHAHAAILCDGNFQNVDGMAVSTPYCQDENLATQEMKRGFTVSGVELRRRPELKREACVSAASTNETACAASID